MLLTKYNLLEDLLSLNNTVQYTQCSVPTILVSVQFQVQLFLIQNFKLDLAHNGIRTVTTFDQPLLPMMSM